jgi:hypothetical protein
VLWPAPDAVGGVARSLDHDRGPGVGTRASTNEITSSTTGSHKIPTGEHQHDDRLCATCCASTVWSPGLRLALERQAWLAARRRVCDLAEVTP